MAFLNGIRWLDYSSSTSSYVLYFLLGLLSSTAFLVYLYPNRFVFTYDRPELPGPPGIPILGNLFQVLANQGRMLAWIDECREKYGNLWTLTMPGTGRTIVVNHPVWIDHIRKCQTFLHAGWCLSYTSPTVDDTLLYTKGSIFVSIFQAFPGSNTPLATDGAEWRSTRRLMA